MISLILSENTDMRSPTIWATDQSMATIHMMIITDKYERRRHPPLAVRLECHAVDGSKVAFHSAKLILKDHVVEASVKLPDPRRRRRHVHRFLSASQHDLRVKVTQSPCQLVTCQTDTGYKKLYFMSFCIYTNNRAIIRV